VLVDMPAKQALWREAVMGDPQRLTYIELLEILGLLEAANMSARPCGPPAPWPS